LYNILIEFGIPPEISKANKNVSEWNQLQSAGRQIFVW
jgi:hypothetical protein